MDEIIKLKGWDITINHNNNLRFDEILFGK